MDGDPLKAVMKLRVRAKDIVGAEKVATSKLIDCLDQWERLCQKMNHTREETDLKEVFSARIKAYKTLKEAMESQSRVEHEKSHLSETLGGLLFDLETRFQELLKTNKKLE